MKTRPVRNIRLSRICAGHLLSTNFISSRKTFEKFDTDKNGEIDSEEFGRLGESS
jgi:Ca2+-binding EF-hand superfamily protein